MGACYTVILRVKPKDEKTAYHILREWMCKHEKDGFCCFSLPAHEKEGLKPDTFLNIIRILLAGWNETPYKESKPDEEGFITCENDFTASYGWEIVLLSFAEALAPLLADGSNIYIEPDDGYHEFQIRNGKLEKC